MGTRLNARYLQPEIIAAAEQSLREADKLAVGNPALESRVRHAHMPIWYMLAKRGPESPTWKLTEAKVGKIDFRKLATNFTQVAKEWGSINTATRGELGPPFTDWLTDYAKRVSEMDPVMPPELKGVDKQTYRVVQACQMDGVATLWRRTEGASDGWCEVLEKSQYGVWCGLMPGQEYVPGKKYKFFVRVKGEGRTRDGVACVCRVISDPVGVREVKEKYQQRIAPQIAMGLTIEDARKQVRISKDVLAEDLADGQFHAVEVAEVVNPTEFSFAVTSDSPPMAKVFLDCFWLVEVLPETVK